MHSYRVFGGVLRSELDFPELPEAPADRDATWLFAHQDGVPPAADLEVLGSDSVRNAGQVLLHRHAGGFRLVYPDTGTYAITEQGRRIGWQAPDGQPYEDVRYLEAVRIDVLGRVLSVAMHAAGVEALHGSAVTLAEGCAVAFVAPKFHGKSTLASALVAAGARLITDDTLPVELGDPPRVSPGVQSLRMWEDSAARLGDRLPGLELGAWGKLQAARIPKEWLVDGPVELAAIYSLAPRRPDVPDRGIERQRLAPVEAAMTLVAHAKLGPLLGKDVAAKLLAWAVSLSARVPVCRLVFPRDFEQLPRVVDQLRAWHEAGS